MEEKIVDIQDLGAQKEYETMITDLAAHLLNEHTGNVVVEFTPEYIKELEEFHDELYPEEMEDVKAAAISLIYTF